MTAKEKALQLISSYATHTSRGSFKKKDLARAIRCAIICCDEVLGYMGADRGHQFWTETKMELKSFLSELDTE
jgi:hypothetical protein